MTYKLLFYVSLFNCLFSQLYGQETTISQDSLDALLSKSYDYYYDYDYKSALLVSKSVIDISTAQNNDKYLSLGYSRLGSIHNAMNDSIKSKDYYLKALEYAKQTKSNSFIAGVYNDLANVYSEDQNNVDLAISYYKKSIALEKMDTDDETGSLASYMNIAWTYLDINRANDAYPYLKKSKEISETKDFHPLFLLNIDILFGRYYFYKNDYKKSITVLEDTAKRAVNDNYLEQASQSYQYLSKAYDVIGNTAASLVNLKAHKAFEDQINTINNEQKLLELSAQFKLEQYQKDLEIAQNEKTFTNALVNKSQQLSTIFIIASSVLLIALFFVFLMWKNRKKYINKLNENNIELTAAKNEAERLSQLKTQFFSTVSHELRTPLYGVIGLSSILLEDEKLKSHKEDLKSLKFSADYLLSLINGVLTLNKTDANGMKLEKVPFQLEGLLRDISTSFTYRLQQGNNKIITHIDKEIPKSFLGDSVKLSQILMNLVGNAVKFSENGTIDVIVKFINITKSGLYRIKFFIKDTGVGIPEDKQQSIFEEFSQVENNNFNYQGTGLGLPIVKKLLELHNSKIELKSVVGAGSIFSFELALEKNENHQDISQYSGFNEDITNFEGIHILIVDDNKINQRVTQKILEKRHFKCSLANDGKEAIQMVQKTEYSLILMDVHMPIMGGIEATKFIRTFNTELPIIALTAVEIEEKRFEILSSGMNDIILKPYDVSQFLSTIAKHLKTKLIIA